MTEPEGTGIDRYADLGLADLALALRRLDLPAFTREVVRRVREGLGVEHCKVLRFPVNGDRSPLRPGDHGERALAGSMRVFPVVGGASVLVCANGCAFGILSAYSASRRGYTEGEICFLRDVAELLGVAAERALVEEVHRREIENVRRRAAAAEEKYAFLHEANAVLTAVPNGPAALAAAARLAVPALADACFVDLIEDDDPSWGRVRRLVVARSDAVGERPAREFTLYYSLDSSAPHGTPKVLRTGRPELIPELGDGLLRSLAGSREHLELTQDLVPGSYLCVPLQVGPRLVGSMGFVSSTAGRGGSGRRYGKQDLTLAECLARCIALVAANPPGGRVGQGYARETGKGTVHRWGVVSSNVPDGEPVLTPRQLEVLGLLDRGMRVHQIKVALGLSEPTVRTHVRGILRAFGACSQLEALHRARVLGLVDGAPGDGGGRRT